MRRLAISVGVSLCGLAVFGSSVALAAKPIKPNQAFEAFVNGLPGGAVIQVACSTTVTPGGFGHPLAGQYLKVKHEKKAVPTYVPGPFGFTGEGTAIVAFDQSPSPIASAIPIILAHFDHYGRQPLPTTALFPCTGTGVIAFVPTDGGQSGYTATVPVTFVGAPSPVPTPASG